LRIVVVPSAAAVPAAPALPVGPIAVIDTLRATTTVAAALAAGAPWVEPVASVAEARRRRAARPNALLAGERGGDRLPGFDLGNSPVAAAALGGGRGLILTTTNGTRACDRLVRAGAGGEERPIYAAALVNAARAAAALRRAAERPGCQAAILVCAGQDGHAAAEDLLTAGAIAAALPAAWGRDDLALMAQWAWERRPDGDLAHTLAACPHGRTLAAKGYGADIVASARVDAFDVLPRLVLAADAPPRFVSAPPA
jgi:2-phosphosulfolactate phosphatase